MPKLHIGHPLEGDISCTAGRPFMKTFDQRRLLLALGLGICTSLLIASIWMMHYPKSLPLGSPSWIEFTLTLFTLAIGHEALHLLGFPKFGFDSKTIIGFWPEFGSPYVQYLSPMQRNRFLLSTILPFLVLTLLPLFLLTGSSKLTAYLSWISVLNSVGAGSDLLIFMKVAMQVPKDSYIMESHDSVYWGFGKPADLIGTQKNPS
jgi:hypothetical protein